MCVHVYGRLYGLMYVVVYGWMDMDECMYVIYACVYMDECMYGYV